MSKFVYKAIALASVVTLATGALADGLPRRGLKDSGPAPFSWGGFYVGLNAGYAWGEPNVGSATDCPSPGGYYCGFAGVTPGGLANVAAINGDGSHSNRANGFTGGVHAGYNVQSGGMVWGVEADFGALALGSSKSVSRTYPGNAVVTYAMATRVDTDWVGTLRARLGFLMQQNVLLYVTGGLAVTDIEVANSFSDDNGAFGSSTNSGIKAGWTVGGGVEIALNRNWLLRAEYQYLDFGAVDTTSTVRNAAFPANANHIATSADLTAHVARAGISYKF